MAGSFGGFGGYPPADEEWIRVTSPGDEYECVHCPWQIDIEGAYKQVEPNYCENCQEMRNFRKV